ncbi:MAG: putative quinol monooxygenase [Streptosporangiaceae bacterium]
MIFITAKFRILPRAEPGCLWFDWSRSVADPAEYVLVEAFRDDAAGAAHVQSEHFRNAQRSLPLHLAQTPRIVNVSIPQDDWSLLGEMAVPARG